MADLVAYQSGDFTGATTWKGVATSTGAVQATINNSTNTTTSDVASSNFTITNALVVEGLLLHCRRLLTTGTVTVGLYKSTTLQQEVVINASDLPTEASWVFFKFGANHTADGSSTYNVRVKSSTNASATFWRDATAGNWARFCRISTTASIATTDRFFIAKELTGQGTNNGDITVTMNSTANTSYGEANVGFGGVLSYGTSASTNYYLRLAGNLNVWGGGTFNIGTSGSRIPSTSTAVLEFNCSSNVQYGLEAQNGSTVNIYGAQKGSTKVLLTADCNSGQAGVTVESTSGWAANDIIAVASTTRTASQSEARTISSVTSGTTATVTSNFSNTHQGTAPYQGEVINLTRNVKVQGTSASLQSYVNCAATSSFTADNCEFFWLGSATANKRGIDSATTSAGSFTLKDCALRDFTVASSRGVNATGASGSPTVDDCVMFGIHSQDVFLTATSGVPVITDNWALNATTNTATFELNDNGATLTGNVAVGGTQGFLLAEAGAIGTFDNNRAHSGSSSGISATGSTTGNISNCNAWRSNGTGFDFSGRITATNCSAFHNNSRNVFHSSGSRFVSCTFDGGTGQSLAVSQFETTPTGVGSIYENCNFGQTNVATSFANLTLNNPYATIFANCNIGETLTFGSQTNLISTDAGFVSVLGFDKLNATSGAHRAYKQFGFSASDQSVFRTASPSEQLNPNSASGKLPSGSKKFGVASGTTATVSVWVRKSATYNGNEPRLIVKRNVIAGITSDTVLATASGATNTWLELTGTTATVSDDCVLEVYVDCDGTAGVVNVDDWSIT